jgi:hypothetical protein
VQLGNTARKDLSLLLDSVVVANIVCICHPSACGRRALHYYALVLIYRFTNMLVRVFQVRSDERDHVLKMLNKTRIRCEKTLNGTHTRSLFVQYDFTDL